jgi:hypothetical protein
MGGRSRSRDRFLSLIHINNNFIPFLHQPKLSEESFSLVKNATDYPKGDVLFPVEYIIEIPNSLHEL